MSASYREAEAPSGSTKLVGFGVNYFQNMGPSQRISLEHDSELNINVPAYMFEKDSTPWEDEADLKQIECTTSATFFLTNAGKIYMAGTLHGRVESPLCRIVIPLPLKCVEIACGRHFGLARMEGGLAVCSWGAGHFGQLGLGHDSAPCLDNPTVIEPLLPHVVGSPIAQVCAGSWHAMALTESGNIYSWGCNRNAQCGIKPTKDPPTLTVPQLVRFDHRDISRVVKVAAGKSHSVALDATGGVYCWGSCNYGQCGAVGRRRGGTAPPKQVEALSQVHIVDIAAGDSHTLALTGGGRVFGWGCGVEGQLGIGAIIQLNPKPKLVADLDFVAIEAGREWKAKYNGQKMTDSNPNAIPRSSAHYHHHLAGIPKVVSIHASGNCSFAKSSSGHVYAWGCNDVGNLGIPKPPTSDLTYSEPELTLVKGSTLRQCHTHSFDSSHNVALPQRIDCLKYMNVTSISASPTFLWCKGTKRPESELKKNTVGRTLNEIEETKREQSLHTSEETITETTSTAPTEDTSTVTNNNDVSEATTKDSYENGSMNDSDNNKTMNQQNQQLQTPNKTRKLFGKTKSPFKNFAKNIRRGSIGNFKSPNAKNTNSLDEPKPKTTKRRSFFGN